MVFSTLILKIFQFLILDPETRFVMLQLKSLVGRELSAVQPHDSLSDYEESHWLEIFIDSRND